MDQSASARSEVVPPLQPCVSSSPVRKSKSSNGIEGNNNGFSAAKAEDESVGEKTGDLIGPQKSHESTSGNQNSGGDVLLQWGQRKRSKRAAGDKLSMHPPRPPPPSSGGTRVGTKLGPNSNGILCSKDGSSRKMGASGGGSGGGATANGTPVSKSNGGSRLISRSGLGKRSHPASEKTEPQHQHQHQHTPPPPFGSVRKDKSSDSMSQSEHSHNHHQQLTSAEGVEWPRIYVALSRKEKEDDFFAMKGTKLPHRPKKRSKAIDRTLQYCFPGTFLSDLSRARYEVRERKSTVKKPKRRGLKGLENMETDSD